MSRLFCLLQAITPQKLLTELVGKIAASQNKTFSQFLIKKFIAKFNIDLSAYLKETPDAFSSFSDFFTRELKPEHIKFPRAKKAIGSPVEATVSQAGKIKKGQLLQAKGFSYGLVELLAGEHNPNIFKQGTFLTAYLSPTDYHRVHMPLDGKLVAYTYIPGRLFSVAPSTLAHCPDVFTRNERLVMHFETAAGPMALVMVGAYLVGQIVTTFAGRIARNAKLNHRTLEASEQTSFKKGDELGHFNFGSSIIMLFTKDAINLEKSIAPNAKLSVGQNICEIVLASTKD